MIGVFELETSKKEENKERMISSLLKNFYGDLVIKIYGANRFKLNKSFDYYNILRLPTLVLREGAEKKKKNK